EDLAWRKVLELFSKLGRPPSPTEICRATGSSPEDVRMHLAELQAHDLIGIDRASGAIVYAYPFTSEATEHQVELYDHTLHALCAIDALGIGGMLRADVTITSSCHLCATSITITTIKAGQAVDYARPVDPIVWYDLAYDQAAATSCCPSIGF